VLPGDDLICLWVPTTRSKACHLPFPPKTLPPHNTREPSPPQPARSHLRILAILLHFAPPHPRLYAPYQPTTQLRLISSAFLSSFPRKRYLAFPVLSVSLEKKEEKRREEKKKDTPIPTSCMHASAFAFSVIFRALDKRLACFLSHHLLTPSLLVSSGYGPWVIRWNRREKEERPLL
jgi:hypothetical protein